jgi:hypothetical protein
MVNHLTLTAYPNVRNRARFCKGILHPKMTLQHHFKHFMIDNTDDAPKFESPIRPPPHPNM